MAGESYTDFRLFETWVEGSKLAYKFDVPPATYTVTLRFAEFAVTQAGKRVMEIQLEKNIVEAALDVYALKGSTATLDRNYTVVVTDGQLNIDFAKIGGPGAEVPMVAAVAVTYAGPLPLPPYVLRVNAGSTTYTDTSARVWQADKAFATGSWGYVGGTTGKSTTAVTGTNDDSLYQKYRTKMTEYKFTVPNGNLPGAAPLCGILDDDGRGAGDEDHPGGPTGRECARCGQSCARQSGCVQETLPGDRDGRRAEHRLCARHGRQPGPGDFSDRSMAVAV